MSSNKSRDTDGLSIGHLLLDELQTAVLLLDQTLQVVYLNDAAESLFGVSARQGLGQPVAGLLAHESVYLAVLQTSLEQQQPYAEHDLELILAQRRSVFVDSTVTPVEISQVKHLLVELVSTGRQQHIAMSQQMLAQYQSTQAMLAGLAHELKNPLGGIRGAAQLLERQFDDPELSEYTQVIIGETDRLTTLLNRMMGGGPQQVLGQVNVHQVTERVRALLEVESGPEIHIVTEYDPSIPEFIADIDQLIQLVLNVARNGVQAMSDGGRLLLRTRIGRNMTLGNQLHPLVGVIEIIDDGSGIPANMLEQIFSPLVTGRPEGTGLGLSIAQSLAHDHGGVIECVSQPGETMFSVILPIRERLE